MQKVNPIKLRKIGGAGLAVVDYARTGPYFGSDGFCVPLDKASDTRVGMSKLGSYYERMPDGSNTIFPKADGGRTQVQLVIHTGSVNYTHTNERQCVLQL
jgi:hypothetical protein